LISADTTPTGGTSDYGPEMLHHAAQGLEYECFVRPDTRLPFMAMPDAIKSLILLHDAPRASISQSVYNVTSFSPSAEEIRRMVTQSFPSAKIDYAPHRSRQRIVDSWPADVDDNAARRDWGWSPDYDQEKAFAEYLIPAIKQRYQK
ncbi:MAG: epimerase, partial [Anaerolineae bacterium]|nr:epimerase [Anaerolineae bacterium]